MIAFLTGRLAFKAPTHLTLDVQGVGYEVHIPLSTYYALPNLDDITALNIHTHLREDAIGAELDPDHKNAISHRGQALDLLVSKLRSG